MSERHSIGQSLKSLPVERTSFVGRGHELSAVCAAVASARVVTLVGVGGVGKTRLAARAAARLEAADAFADGAVFVALHDVSLVPEAIASALNVREQPNTPLAATIGAYLRDSDHLLVLDACEHVVSECAELVAAWIGTTRLRLLATSRVPLEVPGERVYPVPPLATPGPAPAGRSDALRSVGAVRLFTDRASAAAPEFELDKSNAAQVARICQVLEGLPLAIELAAARVRVLTPAQIADRLGSAMHLLTTRGEGPGAAHHVSLRAALDWSHALLDEQQRTLFRQLAVFSGTFNLDAVESVCELSGMPRMPLDVLEGLVMHSLVEVTERTTGPEARYRLLEPVRQYARTFLDAAGERERLATRHAEHYAVMVETATEGRRAAAGVDWAIRLSADEGNLRAALRHSVAVGDAAVGLRLGCALNEFWEHRGLFSEGRHWIEQVLALPGPGALPQWRIDARNVLGFMAAAVGDLAAARQAYAANVAAAREIDDSGRAGLALAKLGITLAQSGLYAEGEASLREGLRLSRAAGSASCISTALVGLGACLMEQGRYDAARECYREAVETNRASADRSGLAVALNNLANIEAHAGDKAAAAALYLECLDVYRAAEHKAGMAMVLNNLGYLSMCMGDLDQAAVHLAHCLALEREMGRRVMVIVALTNLADLEMRRGHLAEAHRSLRECAGLLPRSLRRVWAIEAVEMCAQYLAEVARLGPAALLLGWAAAAREEVGTPISDLQRTGYDRAVTACRGGLGEASFADAWSRGEAMPEAEVAQRAAGELADLDVTPAYLPPGASAAERTATARNLAGLTARERQVAALLAAGLTNQQIADRLFVVPKTVDKHIGNALLKLGFKNRAQIAAWAVAAGLAATPSQED